MNGIVSGKQIKFGEDTQTGNMTIKSLTTIGHCSFSSSEICKATYWTLFGDLLKSHFHYIHDIAFLSYCFITPQIVTILADPTSQTTNLFKHLKGQSGAYVIQWVCEPLFHQGEDDLPDLIRSQCALRKMRPKATDFFVSKTPHTWYLSQAPQAVLVEKKSVMWRNFSIWQIVMWRSFSTWEMWRKSIT